MIQQNSQVVLSDIKKVYHQNNYTNQVLYTVSQQVNIVSTQVEAIVKKQEVDSLTEKLENSDINDTKKDKSNFSAICHDTCYSNPSSIFNPCCKPIPNLPSEDFPPLTYA